MGLGLRRVVLQYPCRGGRFRPESVAAFNRNQWQPSPGIGGRFRPESVATFDRNTHPSPWSVLKRRGLPVVRQNAGITTYFPLARIEPRVCPPNASLSACCSPAFP